MYKIANPDEVAIPSNKLDEMKWMNKHCENVCV